jgi:formylglycine-generating enzyme required for sulfatase activity
MGKTKGFFFMLFMGCCSIGHTQIKEFTAKGIEKEIVEVDDILYAFRCETSNFEYNTFLKVMAEKDSTLYVKYCIDSARWLQIDYNGALAKHYHRYPGFNDYPALCLSYDGAIAYCKWLTELYNNDSNRKFREVSFTLPSEQEWESAAFGTKKGITYPWGTNSLRNTRKDSWQGQFMANYTHIGDGLIVSDSNGNPIFKRVETESQINKPDARTFYTAQVKSFFPNSIGIYNQSGNAAEMTIQKGLTKGGSWKSYGGEITITYRLHFNEPSPEVGFRVFMKIVEQ